METEQIQTSTKAERRYIVTKISWEHDGREPVTDFPTQAEAEQFIQTAYEDGHPWEEGDDPEVATGLRIIPVEMSKENWDSPDISKMGLRIVLFVHSHPTATYAELTRHLGETACGDLDMTFHQHPNLVLWSGVSDLFIDAFIAVRSMLFEAPSNFMVYAMDGQALTLPIATRTDHDTPHWVPMVLSIRTEEHKKEIAEAKRRNERREAKRKRSEVAV
jgi:hypothetical protein